MLNLLKKSDIKRAKSQALNQNRLSERTPSLHTFASAGSQNITALTGGVAANLKRHSTGEAAAPPEGTSSPPLHPFWFFFPVSAFKQSFAVKPDSTKNRLSC